MQLDEAEDFFNSTDIADLLLKNTPAQQGRYDHLQWTVTTGDDATGDLSRVISIHEFMHK